MPTPGSIQECGLLSSGTWGHGWRGGFSWPAGDTVLSGAGKLLNSMRPSMLWKRALKLHIKEIAASGFIYGLNRLPFNAWVAAEDSLLRGRPSGRFARAEE